MTSGFRFSDHWFPISCAVVLAAVALILPQWQFLISIALSKGIVALGLALLLRAGLASFGQALFFAVGAYTVGMLMNFLGVKELFTLLAMASAVSAALAWALGFLLSRYRDIFFAMLTLALSMVMYGILINNPGLGGSDGFNVSPPLLGLGAGGQTISGTGLFALVYCAAVVCVLLVHWFMRSVPGRLGPAIKDNEIRVEYLGASARANIHLVYLIAGALAGIGGALSAFNVGHIDPDMAFWTTSGEFLFIAVLSGTRSAYAPFLGALLLEVAQAVAYRYAPNTWQIAMGTVMLVVIAFLPGGLTSLRLTRATGSASKSVDKDMAV